VTDHRLEGFYDVVSARRDVRNGFTRQPIDDAALRRVLDAAHRAGSVGFSQPWDFLLLRSESRRREVHALAQRQRERYAASLPAPRAAALRGIKTEAILDTPLNIAVTCDPTRGGRHTLGRYTQPQMAPYSAALAVQNLWLAARAEGLGVGWVSFFDERELADLLGLPRHLEVVAYLCVGHVAQFPTEPELATAGWAMRRPLRWSVHEETWGQRGLPGEDAVDLLRETLAAIRPANPSAVAEARDRQDRLTKPRGALGALEDVSIRLAGLAGACPPPLPSPAAVAVFAADHGVHAQAVTP
jgi:nicotinate-nucleotide--dimethylbenzimidazole phosphoribosyltransferase